MKMTVDFRDEFDGPTTADKAKRLEIHVMDPTVVNRSAEQGRALLAHAEASSAT